MYCKKCQNIMDITNNLNNPILTGGSINNINNDINNDNNTSSNYDISYSDSINNVLFGGGNKNVSEDDILNVIQGNSISNTLNNFTIDDLNKFKVFNNLDNDNKVKVFNKLIEFTDKKISHVVHDNENIAIKHSYFYCKSCGYYETIPPQTLLFSRYKNKKSSFSSSNSIIHKFDNTLPSTKKYNCINPQCKTHSNPSSKSAVFFRIQNSYNIKYICTVCDHEWLTYYNSDN